jgi:membrane protein YqaA with SNARE-associated domain
MSISWKAQWAALSALGPPGMFVVTIFDTAFLPTAQAVDLLIITQAAAAPKLAPALGACAVAGSTLGAMILYYIARGGGGWALRKSVSDAKIEEIRCKLDQYGAAALILPAMVPVPLSPMKIFIFAAGALGVQPLRVAAAMAFARTVRYTGLILLGVWYGEEAWEIFKRHTPLIVGAATAALVLYFGVRALRSRRGKSA